jgi:hypothetical protein
MGVAAEIPGAERTVGVSSLPNTRTSAISDGSFTRFGHNRRRRFWKTQRAFNDEAKASATPFFVAPTDVPHSACSLFLIGYRPFFPPPFLLPRQFPSALNTRTALENGWYGEGGWPVQPWPVLGPPLRFLSCADGPQVLGRCDRCSKAACKKHGRGLYHGAVSLCRLTCRAIPYQVVSLHRRCVHMGGMADDGSAASAIRDRHLERHTFF